MTRPFNRTLGLIFVFAALSMGLLVTNARAVLPLERSGSISDAQPFLEIPIQIDTPGQTLYASMRARSGNLDTLLYLVDAAGNIVAENDDLAPGVPDSLLRYVEAARGEYTLIATRYGVTGGGSSGDFDLSVRLEASQLGGIPDYDVSAERLESLGFPVMEPRPHAEWTILAYYGGDTDLESTVMADFNEFELAGGSDEQVRIVALMDRHPLYTTASGNWASARLFEVEADISGDHLDAYPPTIDTEPLADLGALDTGTGETLALFLTWALRHYPADHYAIAFASHGAGWRGIIADDSDESTIISLPELRGAFDSARRATGVQRFDLLINDACLMSSIEYYQAMARYFDLSIASPEIIVDPALDMTTFVEALRSGGRDDLVSISNDLVDLYMLRDVDQRGGRDKEYLSNAVADLTRFSQVTQALERFAVLVNLDPARYSTLLGQARSNAYTYAIFMGQRDKIDLGHFMQQIVLMSTDYELVISARDVLTALEDARLHARGGSFVDGRVAYFNIYFPMESRDFDPDYFLLSDLPNWAQMLRTYYNSTTPRLWLLEDSLLTYHPASAPSVKVTRIYPEVGSTAAPPAIAVEIVGRRIASGSFTVDRLETDGQRVRLADTPILTEVIAGSAIDYVNQWKSGIDRSVFNWLPLTLPRVSDGVATHNEFLQRSGQVAMLSGRYRTSADARWDEVSVVFDLSGRVQSVISEGRSGSFATIRIPAGAEFQAYRTVVTGDGIVRPEPGNIYRWPEDGLLWSDDPTPSGVYNLGFLVTAFGGATGFDTVTVQIDNDDYDPEWRGYTEMNLGLIFERPAEWGAVGDFGDTLFSASDDDDAALNVFYFRAEDNLFEILRQAQVRYGLTLLSSAEVTMLDGVRGLRFDHSYRTTDGTTWRGKALAVYRQTAIGGRALVFSVDAALGTAADAALDALYEQILERVTLFDAASLNALDSGDWGYNYVSSSVPFPVRRDWRSEEATDEFGRWQILRDRNDSSGRTLAAVARLAGTDPDAALEALVASYGAGTDVTLRTYSGEVHTWKTAAFVRDGIATRLYVTRINNRVFALRFAAPEAQAVPVFRSVFEPMLDGFAPSGALLYAGSGVQPAFIKAAVVAANRNCEGIAQGEICFGGGSAVNVEYSGLRSAAPSLALEEVGERRSVTGLERFDVGILPGQIDPYSVALLQLQANLSPGSNQYVRLYAFGGAEIINRALLLPGQVEALQIQNNTANALFIREQPQVGALMAGRLLPGASTQAVARSADGEWLRVRLPEDPTRLGWLFAANVQADGDLLALPIEDPARPHFANLQSIEVRVDPSNPNTVNGILIETAPGNEVTYLEINGVLFEIAPGTLFFWQANMDTLAEDDQGDSTTAKRRPAGWFSEVLRGSIRVRFRGVDGRERVLTSVAGLRIGFEDEEFELMTSDSIFSQSFATSFENTLPPRPLNEREVQQISEQQDELNNQDLDEVSNLGTGLSTAPDVQPSNPLTQPMPTPPPPPPPSNIVQAPATATPVPPAPPAPPRPNPTSAPDRDRDGIPDHLDQCANIPGVPPTGCPPTYPYDLDGDGIPNIYDYCPTRYAPPNTETSYWGCPPNAEPTDSDGDGIPDIFDACPYLVGEGSYTGCPGETEPTDSDEDGVPDYYDYCPFLHGQGDPSGCPPGVLLDTDGDGVPDIIDECPAEFGDPQNYGCPYEWSDSDGDGVPDEWDECPFTPGDPPYGCPSGTPEPDWDSDGDGFFDSVDACPFQFGYAPDGCFDSDSDGFANDVDLCPFQFGWAPDGCFDSDGDNVPNNLDACPLIWGDGSDGCPIIISDPPLESDSDGVPDDLDACPFEWGDGPDGCLMEPIMPPEATQEPGP